MAEATTTLVVEQVDPRTLLTDRNIREAKPDADLVASIRDIGLEEPIVVVRTAEGQLRVRHGEHRTLASIEAERESVPVIVIGDEGTTKADEIARIIGQRAANTYRKGLTRSEHASAIRQLNLLGVSDAQIAKKLRIPKADVKASRLIAKSEVATSIVDEYDLDLTQVAAIAEFEGNQQRVDQLVSLARRGWGFDQAVARMRLEDEEAATRRAFVKSLEAQGLRVVDAEPDFPRGPVMYLSDLYDEHGHKLDPEAHKTCPGHAAVVEQAEFYITPDGTEFRDRDDVPDEVWDDTKSETRPVSEPVCDQADALHLPQQDAATEPGAAGSEDQAEREAREAAEREKAKAQRARVIAGNKEWDAAMPVRRDWVEKFLKRKTPPAGATAFIAGELLRAPHHLRQAFQNNHPLAPTLLGVTVENDTSYYSAGRIAALQTLAEGASDKRLLVVMLGLIMSANENALTRQSWRNDWSGTQQGCAEREYLRFIIDQGYPACGVERLAAGLSDAEENDQQQDAEENDQKQAETDQAQTQGSETRQAEEQATQAPDGDQEDPEAA